MPVHGAVGCDGGGPSAFGDEPVVHTAGQDEALVDGGAAFGAPEVQNSSGDIVEHGQAQVGVGGQTDDISGRDLGAVGGVSGAGAGVEFGGADSDDDGDGQPVVVAESPGGQGAASEGHQRVMLALPGGAGVGVDVILAGSARGAGGVVVRVAHALAGECGEDRSQVGPEFRGDCQPHLGHAVGVLLTEDAVATVATALFDLVIVGFGSVGVEDVQQVVGGLA